MMCGSAKTARAVQAAVNKLLGAIQSELFSVNNLWNCDTPLNGMPVEFNIDTGADVSVIINL